MPEISTNHTSQPQDALPHPPPDAPLEAAADIRPQARLPDLRRRNARLQAEIIARRACFLPHEQRALVVAVYMHNQSLAELAALMGQPARKLRRDVRRILARLASHEFAFVALHLEHWPITMRRVAQTCVLAGEPVRSAARSLHLSLYTVRKHRDMVRLLACGALPPLPESQAPRSKAG